MTKLQIKELLKQHHPHLSSKLSDMYIELSANTIAQDSGIINRTFLLNSTAGKRWYPLDPIITKVEKVYFRDVRIPRLIGEPLIDDDEIYTPSVGGQSPNPLSTPSANLNNKRFWMLSDYDFDITDYAEDSITSSDGRQLRLGIVEGVTNAVTRDGKSTNYQSCSITEVHSIRVYAQATTNKFASTDDATKQTVGPLRDIPLQFHDVLLSGAIARGYKDPTNFKSDMYQFFNNEFEMGVKRMKKFARTKTGTGFIRPQDF
tara:strand:+ start:346 stop:1125 length:780 start_codon:yes stop_codon:yes gene_type:complete